MIKVGLFDPPKVIKVVLKNVQLSVLMDGMSKGWVFIVELVPFNKMNDVNEQKIRNE